MEDSPSQKTKQEMYVNNSPDYVQYGLFSKFHVCFCGLDPGNLKFEIARTDKQHICF